MSVRYILEFVEFMVCADIVVVKRDAPCWYLGSV